MKRKKQLEKGFEITSITPNWIKRTVPDSYADDGLRRIVLFYVINTPCTDLSSSGLSMQHYGWKKDVWKNNRLKSKLFEVANFKREETFLPVKRIDEMRAGCKSIGMSGKFCDDKKREVQRVVFYKPPRYNEIIAMLYHIRNSLAHGRLAMYPIKGEKDIMFVLEDGLKKHGEFEVRSRMILRKSTLLSWINIIEKGKIEDDTSNR